MAEYTQNYNLKKPAEDDFYNVKDFNDNADIIDAELKKAQDHRENASNPHKVMADQVGAINPNLAINGDFRVNQRGQYTYSEPGYTFDRWRLWCEKSDVTGTVSRGESNSEYGIGGYYAHIVLSSVSNADNDGLNFFQAIDLTSDEGKVLQNKTVTFSAWCYTDADYRMLYIGYLKDGEWVYLYSAITQYSANRYSVSIDIPYDATMLEFGVACSRSLTENDVDTLIDVAECKLEIGSVATEFSPRSYAEELAMCQRYFQRKNSAKQPYNTIGQCFIHYNKCFALIHLPVKLRAAPTCTQKGVLCATTDTEPEITIQSVNGISDDTLKIYCSSEQPFSEDCLFELRANNDVNGDIWIDAEIY